MEMHEITEREDSVVELEKMEEPGAAVFSKQKSRSENLYVESPDQLPTTDTPVEEAESTIYSKLTSPTEDIYSRLQRGRSLKAAVRLACSHSLLCVWNNNMYIKFGRIVSGGPAKLSNEVDTKLSVELNEPQKQDLQVRANVGKYRAFCLLLSLICLVLLMVITVLSVKLQSTPPVCSDVENWIGANEEGGKVNSEMTEGKEGRSQSTQDCSLQKCQEHYPEQFKYDSECRKCEKGWLYFEGACYFLSRNRMTWIDSRDECQKKGGNLAIINNQRVQTFLTKNGNLEYWIGLRRRTGTWFWVNNTAVGHSYWSDTRNQYDCGVLTGRDPPERSWTSSLCHVSIFYICQRGQ
ncbi:hypothetical protein DPEC_G00143670 [Dallia pectoralis]|uniref:Uncharacterized protein n=1 Tax=Dallia pectoralis TaxID=75939 RepID=A0ACC2GNT6_DALPE|nr:hypothetical protein DPEC_G00143670 [Dallia pectoralis]